MPNVTNNKIPASLDSHKDKTYRADYRVENLLQIISDYK